MVDPAQWVICMPVGSREGRNLNFNWSPRSCRQRSLDFGGKVSAADMIRWAPVCDRWSLPIHMQIFPMHPDTSSKGASSSPFSCIHCQPSKFLSTQRPSIDCLLRVDLVTADRAAIKTLADCSSPLNAFREEVHCETTGVSRRLYSDSKVSLV